MNVEAILAHSKNFVIGKGNGMPWHHSADFKRFAAITKGHALLMGAKTFLGIVDYFKSTKTQILPERKIFILADHKGDHIPLGHHVHRRGYGPEWTQLNNQLIGYCKDLALDTSNLNVVLNDDGPTNIIRRISPMICKDQTLFIAGGAKVYREYLPLASTIHVTVIDTEVPEGEDIVSLHEDSIALLKDRSTYRTELESYADHKGLTAFFHRLEKK